MDTKQVVARFEAERQALAMMDHPNIARVFDGGTTARHYLADEPVQACPPTVGYQMRKMVRRHKGPMLAVSLVLLALVAGIVGTSWGLIRADRARDDAVAAQIAEANRAEGESRARGEAQKAAEAERKAAAAEIAQRRRAEDNAKLATAVLDEIILKQARQRLSPYMQNGATGPAENPERQKLEREYLDKGLKFYEQLAQTNATDWAARRARARAYANVGLLRLDLKNYGESEKAYRQAVALMEELAGERPGDFDNAFDLAYTNHWFYRAYFDTRRIEPAEQITRQAFAQFEKLAVDFPDRRAVVRENEAYCLRNLAGLLQSTGRAEEAEKSLRQCIAIWTELAAANKYAGYRNALAYDNAKLGEVYQQTGRFSEAGVAWREAQALYAKLAAEFPGESAYLSHMAHLDWSLARLLKQDGKPKEAEAVYRRSLRRFEKLTTAFPAAAFYRVEQAYTCCLLGALLKETGPVQEVETAYGRALPLHEKLASDFPDNAEYRLRLSNNLAELAENLLQQAKHAEAAEVAGKTAALSKDIAGYETAAHLWMRCMALAEKDTELSEADRKAVAKTYADRARELRGQVEKRRQKDPDFWSQRGDASLKQGKKEEAIAHYTRAIALKPDDARYWNQRGAVYLLLRRWDEAVADYTKAIALKPDEAWFFHERCYAYLWLRQFDKAAADCTRGIELNPREWSFWARRGDAYRNMGQHDKALADYMQVIALVPKEAGAWSSRGNLYAELGQWDKAAADFAKAGEIQPAAPQRRYHHAMARLGAADVMGYSFLCGSIFERFGKTEDPDTSY